MFNMYIEQEIWPNLASHILKIIKVFLILTNQAIRKYNLSALMAGFKS